MRKCDTCKYDKICEIPDFVRNDLKTCKTYAENKIKTNADRIRSMSDEELAEFFNHHDCVCDFCTFNMGCLQHETVRCKEGFLNWLKSPATD